MHVFDLKSQRCNERDPAASKVRGRPQFSPIRLPRAELSGNFSDKEARKFEIDDAQYLDVSRPTTLTPPRI
jgi:hypothetical protein